jgi:hypothetical protein
VTDADLYRPQAMPVRRFSWRHFSWGQIALLAIPLAVAAFVALLAYNQVSSALTEEDEIYVEKILQETGHGAVKKGAAARLSFEQQINVIAAVQDAVLLMTPKDDEIPLDHGREPRDVYELRQGICFDRSRVIEKALNYAGLRARHVAVYSTAKAKSALRALMTPQVDSHAVTEVKTVRGWMVIDSNARWMGLTASGQPFTLKALKNNHALAEPAGNALAVTRMDQIFRSDFTYVIGLFSRHGHFYPPYTSVPDVNWRELLYNVAN